jgi:hypothetical protein
MPVSDVAALVVDVVLLELEGDEVSSLSSLSSVDVSRGPLVVVGRVVVDDRSVVVCCAVDELAVVLLDVEVWLALPVDCVALVVVELPVELPVDDVLSIGDGPCWGSLSPQPVVHARPSKAKPCQPKPCQLRPNACRLKACPSQPRLAEF